ncbi:exopolysaccharide biosynthesis protein [Tianweitania sp. BSSL-BM11]|uniref:Exopolysaccharide biosynthesis protein n=1 Tax=Tianweitania aestuarii TaxID=2814886 RepID=A0ABS5S1W7_9HYPH|nr:exopolysaccharide biosynthesis protein [Tianweitania aestuarii]MBS9722474.1 exopolysaccharide biosynthesis protein [Tianweitania aestuarii]
MTDFQDSSESLRGALMRTISQIRGEQVTLRELVQMIGEQGLLLLCALLTIPFLLPVSIPGVSTVFGIAIILISIGIITNRAPWLPERLMDRPLDADKLNGILKRGADMVAKIERVIRPRLRALTDGAFVNRLNGFGIMAGGILLIFPLGLIPFSNTLPAFATLFLCLGISQRDGLFVLFGYLTLVATVIYFAVLAYLALAAGQGLASFFSG